MLNGKHRQPGPVPGPLCGRYAHVLPVLDDLTDTRLAADTRAHLTECAWCRAQCATYNRFDEALRLHFAPDAVPFLPINTREFSMPDIHENVSAVISADEYDKHDGDDDALQLTVSPLPIPPHPPRRSWRLATGAASLAAVLVISLLAGLIFVSHGRPQSASNRHATSTPGIVTGSQVSLTAIGMSSASDGWAMGSVMGQNGGSSEDPGYVLHYSNGRWAQAPNTPVKSDVTAIKMFSPSDGWAIGNHVYHYDGVAWREVTLPVATQFNAIAAVSPTDIWIAGDGSYAYPPDGNTTILHYDGKTWTRQATPRLSDYFSITGLAMVSPTEGWAVGMASLDGNKGYYPPTGAILHYVNSTWRLAKTLPSMNLQTISMGSVTDGWVGGNLVTYSKTGQLPQTQSPDEIDTPKLWRYSSGQWVEVSAPQDSEQPAGYPEYGQILSIKMATATKWWLFASFETQTFAPNNSTYLSPSIFQLENGHWTLVPAPLIHGQRFATLRQVSVISPNELWGIGECIAPNGAPYGTGYLADVTPLIIHYKNGVWSVVES